jgi:histidinol-phosphate aminotransferase
MIKSKPLVSAIGRPAPDTLRRTNLLRLDKNERTTLFSDREFQAMMSTITPFDIVAYSELEPIYEAFTKWLNIKRENILLTSGSDAGIKAIFETFVEVGDEIINLDPNYAMFSVYAKMFGATEIVKQYNQDFSIDIEDLISSISAKTKLIVISNPGHNGITTPESDLLKVINAAERFNAIVVVDEAYFHFSKVSMLVYINEKQNILVVRTLSKAFGLAALRIGLLLGCAEIIGELYRVKLVHEVDGIAAKIAKYMIENIQVMDNYISSVREGQQVLEKRFREMDITLFPSDSNFAFFNLNRQADLLDIIEQLKLKNIYLRSPIKTPPFSNLLRITLGDAKQMNTFCDELDLILKPQL